jgi:hypothetical protein
MEACDTSMEKFYTTMHKIKETKHLDILLRRMINHVKNKKKKPKFRIPFFVFV